MSNRYTMTAMGLLLALGLAVTGAPNAGAQQQGVAPTPQDMTTRDYNESREQRDDALVPDSDGDGFISAEEAEADWTDSFGRFDADQDQELSEQEYLFQEGPAFGDIDADTSGTISQDEWVGYGSQSYEDALTEMQGEQMTTRDYDEMRAWRDEELVPSTSQ